MINEIDELSSSLRRCKQTVPTEHRWIQKLRNSETLILRVGVENGQPIVKEAEYCDADRAVHLWKVEKDNHNTFPALNLYGPLFKVDVIDPNVQRLLAGNLTPVERATCLDGVVFNGKFSCDEEAKKLCRHLYEFPKADFPSFAVDPKQDKGAFGVLIQTFDGLNCKVATLFLEQLVRLLLNHCKGGRLDSASDMIQDLLIGKWDKKKEEFTRSCVSVYFDLADYGQSLGPHAVKITNLGMKEFVSQCLMQAIQEKEKMPNPRLPFLGNTPLMSMDENAFCHDRYGLGSTDDIFPWKAKAQVWNDALKFITDPKREGKTWIVAPSGKWDRQGGKQRPKSDLLIAYVEEMPHEEFENARLLGGTERTTETNFESLAGTVCDTLRNKIPATENPHLRLLLIRRIDKGKTQLVLAERLTVQSLFDAVRRWKDAAKNCPSFSLLMPPLVKGDKAIVAKPVCPFPSEIVELLQHEWIRGGADSHKLEGPKLGEIYEVFFVRERTQAIVSILLEKTIQRIGPLMLGIGQAEHSKWKSEQDRERFDGESKRAALRAFVLLGILLSEIGRKKEDYMRNAPYYIGRMFSLADTLHAQYCEHERGKKATEGSKIQLPGQLIGNAHIRIAMENPTRGLARLEERLLIYKAWADRFQGEQAGLAKWCLNEMGKVAEKLAELSLPLRMDDAARAEMFLGYLAHPGKEVIADKGNQEKEV